MIHRELSNRVNLNLIRDWKIKIDEIETKRRSIRGRLRVLNKWEAEAERDIQKLDTELSDLISNVLFMIEDSE